MCEDEEKNARKRENDKKAPVHLAPVALNLPINRDSRNGTDLIGAGRQVIALSSPPSLFIYSITKKHLTSVAQ